jgi:hypothetical protein
MVVARNVHTSTHTPATSDVGSDGFMNIVRKYKLTTTLGTGR